MSNKDIQDPWGVWAARLVRKKEQGSMLFWSFYARLNCLYWKVTLGEGCRFWGKMYFKRTPGSTIIVGKNCRFRSASWSNMAGINRPCILCTLSPQANISIGEKTGLSGTVVSAADSITIGSNVLCGANVTITDTDWHHVDNTQDDDSPVPSAPITIGSNVWLGMNVIILKGVTIGDNTVIAANSVVTEDIPENTLAAGQPAKVVRHL